MCVQFKRQDVRIKTVTSDKSDRKRKWKSVDTFEREVRIFSTPNRWVTVTSPITAVRVQINIRLSR